MQKPPKGTSEVPVLDRATALDRIGDDEELLAELTEVFLLDFPQQMLLLDKALSDGENAVVYRQAHSLKSAAASVGASRLSQATAELESIARQEVVLADELKKLRAVVDQEFQSFVAALNS